MSIAERPKQIFVDGQAGTTALAVYVLIANREDLEIIRLSDHERKSESARRKAIETSDLTILCLPDDAALESATWANDCGTKVIDASTAHRVDENWAYGLPELGIESRKAILDSNQIANPGCYPTGVILLLKPLIEQHVIAADCPLVVHALSGYSGGGRSLIEKWQHPDNGLSSLSFSAPYSLTAKHKHIPEMMRYSGLKTEPQFLPRVGPFYRGMRVEIPLHSDWFKNQSNNATLVREVLDETYREEKFVEVVGFDAAHSNDFRFDPKRCNHTNRIELTVCEHSTGHIVLFAILDNLGKGASSAAVQCMNLMLGVDEDKGLIAYR